MNQIKKCTECGLINVSKKCPKCKCPNQNVVRKGKKVRKWICKRGSDPRVEMIFIREF